MKTSKAQFESKVELIPTAKRVGISGSYQPAGRLVSRCLQRIKKIKFKYNTSLLYCDKVYFNSKDYCINKNIYF